MRMREITATLLGSAIVYVVMAACSGPGGDPSRTTGIGADVPAGSGGSGAVASGGGQGSSPGAAGDAGGVLDALTKPVPSAMADPVSGTRLKAKFRTGSDGSKAYVPLVWHDSQRQEDCSFTLAADGTERCLPSGPAFGVYFGDSGCTQAVTLDTSGCSTRYTIKYDPPSGCGGTSAAHVHGIGAQVNLTTVYVQTGGSCIPTSAAPGYTYYEVGAEIPASDFVQGTVQADP